MIDVQHWLAGGSVTLLAAVVFAESGLLIGFVFLPGDTLQFVAGFLASTVGGHLLPPLPIVAAVTLVISVAPIAVEHRRHTRSVDRR